MAPSLGRALLTSTRGPHFQPSSDGDVLHLSNRGTPAEEALLPNTLQTQFRPRSVRRSPLGPLRAAPHRSVSAGAPALWGWRCPVPTRGPHLARRSHPRIHDPPSQRRARAAGNGPRSPPRSGSPGVPSARAVPDVRGLTAGAGLCGSSSFRSRWPVGRRGGSLLL